MRKYDKVIVGNSAGALALCKDCILTKNKDNPETTIISGFGLVDFSVEVHYNASKDRELKKLSKKRKIYALRERVHLFVIIVIYHLLVMCICFMRARGQSVEQTPNLIRRRFLRKTSSKKQELL